MKKHTLEEVRQSIKEMTNGKLELLSNEYINNRTPLLLKCSCGNLFKRTFEKLKNGFVLCPNCSKEKQSQTFRKPLPDVLETIKNLGCEYVSGEYTNNKSILTLRCKCGNLFQKSFAKLISGQSRCPACGRKTLSDKKKKYDTESAKKILFDYGYKMIDENFIDAQHKTLCKCKNGHECYIVLSQLLNGRSGCMKCAREGQKGNNSPHYNGGVSSVFDLLRQALDKWKETIAQSYEYKCAVTEVADTELVVHHLTSLNTIFKEVAHKYGENPKTLKQLKDFSSYSIFDKIRRETLEKHVLKTGILISKTIHLQFHSEYGRQDNTPEQFDEFLRKHFDISLSDIQLKQKEGV